ncbi:MAG: hypothetical protein JWQ61_899, partial [Collimonas fungivorans]|nr:hypothetical protein [Collimonas fungivorans]
LGCVVGDHQRAGANAAPGRAGIAVAGRRDARQAGTLAGRPLVYQVFAARPLSLAAFLVEFAVVAAANGRAAGDAHAARLHRGMVGDVALRQRGRGQAAGRRTGDSAADGAALQVGVARHLDLEPAVAGLDSALLLHAGVVAGNLALVGTGADVDAVTVRPLTLTL